MTALHGVLREVPQSLNRLVGWSLLAGAVPRHTYSSYFTNFRSENQ